MAENTRMKELTAEVARLRDLPEDFKKIIAMMESRDKEMKTLLEHINRREKDQNTLIETIESHVTSLLKNNS
ncbi:hypothetical protein SESBI_15688 [Sesbania bispinosa]|nr:hypothetical protein SESBI_15688 [Sesbania bispinosa]